MSINRYSVLVAVAILVSASRPILGAELPEGFTEPYQQIELAVGESGVLESVYVKEGSRVNAGQVLAQLDTSVLERTLDIARQRSQSLGALQAAQAELELRAKYWQQLSQLHDRGHATQHEIDRAVTDVKVAEARVAMAEEELELQKLECSRIEAQIERRIVRSPLKGVVSEVVRDAGESFLANDPRVITVVQLERLRAKFYLDPDLATTMQPGQPVRLAIGRESAESPGTIETISPVMDAKSGTVEVTVAIENPSEAIPSGVRCWLLADANSPPAESSQPTRYTSSAVRGGKP